MKNSQKIYETIKANIGKDFSTNNDLGCAETVNAIVKIALGYEVGGGVSTAQMYKALKTSKLFIEVTEPENGDIILSPTGTGNGGLEHGHVGFIFDNTIAANNSLSGKLQTGYYTVRTWKDYYGTIGGFPTLFYRAVDTTVEPQNAPEPTKVLNMVDFISQEDTRPIYKSASKVVFISLAITACIALFNGILKEENFMLLATGAFSYYFANKKQN